MQFYESCRRKPARRFPAASVFFRDKDLFCLFQSSVLVFIRSNFGGSVYLLEYPLKYLFALRTIKKLQIIARWIFARFPRNFEKFEIFKSHVPMFSKIENTYLLKI